MGNASAWAQHDDIEEATDEATGYPYFTDPRTGAHAWSFQVLGSGEERETSCRCCC